MITTQLFPNGMTMQQGYSVSGDKEKNEFEQKMRDVQLAQAWQGVANNQAEAARKQAEAQERANRAAQGTLSSLRNVTGGGGSVNLSLEGLGLPNLDVNQFRDIADPFWQQRGQYQTQLSDLMKNPGSMTSSPMYQFALDQGMNAVNRTAAAKGMLGSGGRLAELTKFGQGLASQQFYPMANLLGGFAGANAGSPGTALSSLVGARGQDINAATDLTKADIQANTARDVADIQANTQLKGAELGLQDPLGFAKLGYQMQQDQAAEEAARKAKRDFEMSQGYRPTGVFTAA